MELISNNTKYLRLWSRLQNDRLLTDILFQCYHCIICVSDKNGQLFESLTTAIDAMINKQYGFAKNLLNALENQQIFLALNMNDDYYIVANILQVILTSQIKDKSTASNNCNFIKKIIKKQQMQSQSEVNMDIIFIMNKLLSYLDDTADNNAINIHAQLVHACTKHAISDANNNNSENNIDNNNNHNQLGKF